METPNQPQAIISRGASRGIPFSPRGARARGNGAPRGRGNGSPRVGSPVKAGPESNLPQRGQNRGGRPTARGGTNQRGASPKRGGLSIQSPSAPIPNIQKSQQQTNPNQQNRNQNKRGANTRGTNSSGGIQRSANKRGAPPQQSRGTPPPRGGGGISPQRIQQNTGAKLSNVQKAKSQQNPNQQRPNSGNNNRGGLNKRGKNHNNNNLTSPIQTIEPLLDDSIDTLYNDVDLNLSSSCKEVAPISSSPSSESNSRQRSMSNPESFAEYDDKQPTFRNRANATVEYHDTTTDEDEKQQEKQINRIGLNIPSPSSPWNKKQQTNSTNPKEVNPASLKLDLSQPQQQQQAKTKTGLKAKVVRAKTPRQTKTKKRVNNNNNTQNSQNSNHDEQAIISQWMSKPDDPSTQIFGVSIDIAVERGTEESKTLNIPLVALKTSFRIREHMKDEGIFRLSGTHSKIQYWKKRYDLGDDPDLDDESDPHVISGLLKLYLRELPESLLTNKLLPNFEASKSITDPQVKGLYIKSLIDQLPDINYAVLNWITILLINIISYEEINKMGVENISLIFGPTLKCSVVVVRAMLENFDVIFDRVV